MELRVKLRERGMNECNHPRESIVQRIFRCERGLRCDSFAVRPTRRILSGFAIAAGIVLSPVVARQASAQQPMQWPQDQVYDDIDGSDEQSYAQPPSYPIRQYGNQQQGYPQQDQYYPQQGYAQQGYAQPEYGQQQVQPLNPEELEQLVAPIALYPDAVLAQILAASTYPAQVSAADQWLRSMGNASPEMVAAGATSQTSWDPSVKALTAFPQVLEMLDRNLQWTTTLGNAYYNQPEDVLQTVQVMRGRAEQAGTLQSTPQEEVTNNQGYIQLAPTNSDVVYVPTYNPWAVYGQPVSPYPDFSPVDAIGSVIGTAVEYGLGFAVSAFTQTPFGLLSWGLDWLANAVLFDHSAYCSRSYEVRDWGFPHGGPRAFDRWGGNGGGYRNFGRGEMGYNRGSGYPYARPQRAFGNGIQNGFNRGSGYPSARPERSLGNGLMQGNRGGTYGNGYVRPVRPEQQAFNHMPAPIARPQSYGYGQQGLSARPQQFVGQGGGYRGGGSAYGYGGARPMQNFGGRQGGMAYAAPSQGFRSYGSGGYGGSGFMRGGGSNRGSSNGFAGSYGQPHSSGGGFHLFGGGHGSQGYGGGGGHAPKGFSFGGGHSSGGFGGHSGGGLFGGGHSSGGGHFGGGHSGGGHSGGGHSGGHGHSR
jgi:uncharacterized membrane protein YgcG